MRSSPIAHAIVLTFGAIVALTSSAYAQDEIGGRKGGVDESLKSGFAAMSGKNFKEAQKAFEAGIAIVKKSPEPSNWLFTKIQLPDEDGTELQSKDPNIRQITAFRHSMGTTQALLMFASFAAQLGGDAKTAAKYLDEVYGMQGALWGTSWRTFIPPLQALFFSHVAADESDSYARYLDSNGQLLLSAGEETGLKLVREAHRRLPQNPIIAARLAGYLVIRLEAAEAKKLAEIALATNPKQERVLIDLAVAEWLLANTEAAALRASEAAKLAPELPGPHATLALVAVENNDLATAAKESKTGVELSNRHPFYLLVQAIGFEAAGRKKDADQLINEAWPDSPPTVKDLEKWYMRGRARILVTDIMARYKKSQPGFIRKADRPF